MPRILDYVKNSISINDISDIPEKYREAVINNVENPLNGNLDFCIIPGETGEVINSFEQLKDVFNNNDLLYFGHGTSGEALTIDAILEEGLRVKNSELVAGYDSHLRGFDSTSILLGLGSDSLFSESNYLLNNWPHKNANNIIVIALPSKYVFSFENVYFGGDCYEQFYIQNETGGYSLRPEFIMGIYQAGTNSFVVNKNFYKSLSNHQKISFFDDLDNAYIKAFAHNVCVSPDNYCDNIPINKYKMDNLFISWYSVQLEKLNSYNMSIENSKGFVDDICDDFDLSNWDDFEVTDWDEEIGSVKHR